MVAVGAPEPRVSTVAGVAASLAFPHRSTTIEWKPLVLAKGMVIAKAAGDPDTTAVKSFV